MRVTATQNGLTLRVIAGTTNVILGIDLAESQRQGCLGFSIQRVDLGPAAAPFAADQQKGHWLPNLLRFPSDQDGSPITTERAPLQKFRWGDYTTESAHRYRYRVVPRYGAPGKLTPDLSGDDGVTLEVTTEDNQAPATSVFFNRAAAASEAFADHFPQITTEDLLLGDSPLAQQARKWLSRGLEEALLAYLAKATDATFALHAVVYEFQKPNLLAGLHQALGRGAEVKVVYHHRQTKKGGAPDPTDQTAGKNADAAHAAGLDAVSVQRSADPQGAIMHNKFVVLLEKKGDTFVPQAVWTGSTNWTDGGIYGQLNVGHALYDPEIAATYEACFQLLHADPTAASQKKALAELTPVPSPLPATPRTWALFSPQSNLDMIHLYAKICSDATCLMVCAPFELHAEIRKALLARPQGTLHYLLLDQKKSLGSTEEVDVQQGDPRNTISVATTLPSPLHDFQGKLLAGKESFLHAGIHIHSKIILADPFGPDPILVTGSANYSTNSTTTNDSNTLVLRGDTSVADIYATEFMRMFEHYHFRASEATALAAAKKAGQPAALEPLNLKESDAWTAPYYVAGSFEELDRRTFAGTAA
ncbi:MAG TPA: phospholipase D-like domain-containing protein [Thermoanaerobaculia bacterium]|jgi:phosphatidylserine/phosphatidylglycerophosphate/cardiolipin synthase-like enzyme|nr:phospholipase D-like domain-containing protein [Thermoanaerobaculia bacterium]